MHASGSRCIAVHSCMCQRQDRLCLASTFSSELPCGYRPVARHSTDYCPSVMIICHESAIRMMSNTIIKTEVHIRIRNQGSVHDACKYVHVHLSSTSQLTQLMDAMQVWQVCTLPGGQGAQVPSKPVPDFSNERPFNPAYGCSAPSQHEYFTQPA